MRLKKLKELIHHSKHHMNCEKAYVKVYFQDIIDYMDDPMKYDIVSKSQFTVKRVVNQESRTTYFINNRESK